MDYAPPELDENDWKYQMDNNYASELFSSMKDATLIDLPRPKISTTLCGNCESFRRHIWTPGFAQTFNPAKLQATSTCDLCLLLWRTCTRHGVAGASSVTLERVASFMKLSSKGVPVLSLVRSPQQEFPLGTDLQLGFVDIPEAGSATHLGAIQHWLKDCDLKHDCQPTKYAIGSKGTLKTRLPTRLLDLGLVDDGMVRLWETSADDSGAWVALSHQWGSRHLSTTRKSLEKHIQGMEIHKLPATFRDAITVTRALRHRYLWIDSLCVIQGPDGDFRDEAKRMEEVYSGAYCVIAASSAADHFSGFLKPRNARDYVGLESGGKDKEPFYICQSIDNFKSHVLDGALHSRGWVYQEHALARRTVFFTEHQTYYECGAGVRCETSTKLKK